MQFSAPGPQVGGVVPAKAQVTSASFHADGQHLFVASGDSKLQIIDCQLGKQISSTLKFEREGISKVEATHHDHSILAAGSDLSRYAIHYHSIHDNKILRKFRGHSDAINNMSMSPADDSFLTSSRDGTVRLWSLQQAGMIGKMELPPQAKGDPFVSYDSTGLVFGITAAMAEGQGHYIHLYDARNYAGGAFAEMKVTTAMMESVVTHKQARSLWTSMKFNASGNSILINGENGLCITLDGYEGTLQRSLSGQGVACACWTPDDKNVLTGNEDGTISCWTAETGAMIRKLEGHNGSISWIGVNPKYSMFASCDTNTALWIW